LGDGFIQMDNAFPRRARIQKVVSQAAAGLRQQPPLPVCGGPAPGGSDVAQVNGYGRACFPVKRRFILSQTAQEPGGVAKGDPVRQSAILFQFAPRVLPQ
jgi:hypothetical protein